MKRILFVHQTSAIGGGSYCLLNILREIDKSMIEPVVCLASDGPLRKEIESLKISVVFFRKMVDIPYNKNLWSIYSLLQYFKVKKSISAFQSLLQSSRIDVVYLNNMMLYNYLKSAKNVDVKLYFIFVNIGLLMSILYNYSGRENMFINMLMK